jgi:tetratricopeptide (TPR) repeat protein
MPSLQFAQFAIAANHQDLLQSQRPATPRRFLQALALAFVLSGVAVAQAQEPFRYSLPDRKGALSVQLGPLQIQDMSFKPDGTGVRILAHSPEGLIMTLFLQPAEKPGDSTVCRNEWWSKTRKGLESKVKMKDVKTYELGPIAVAEYTVPDFNGAPVNQKSVHAYFAGGDLWSEIHLSKVQFQKKDEKLFSAVLDKAKMDATYVPTPADYLQFGSAAYLQKDYKNAARYYQRTLDAEKQTRTLSKIMFQVLVDNLGMAYGISGDLEKSRSVLEYGISQDPDYPLFYYNMACYYGELGRRDEAIEQLRKAYARKAHVIPGEGGIPDPLEDSSFTKFKRDRNFIDAVAELKRLP